MPVSTWVTIAVGLLLALFSFIGLLYLTRGNPIERIRLLGDSEEGCAVRDDRWCEVFQTHVDVNLEPGHDLEVLFNGEQTYPSLWEDLRRAESLITWHVFWFKPGRLADELREILEERARAGVQVLMLRDFFGSMAIGRWGDYWDSLEEAGVELATFRPLRWNTLHKVQQRSHTRCVVIDGTIGYTGGFAIADEWLGDGRHEDQWRDTSVRAEGPAVVHLQSAFAAAWAEATGELIMGEKVFPRSGFEEAGPRFAGLVYSAPSVGSTDAERYFALSIAGARETLYITNAYFIPDDDFRRFLGAAVERGVDVRVLTPGRNTDKKMVWFAGRKHFEELLEKGVRLWEYDPTMVHAKTLVADRIWSSIGTINFDNRSMSLNDEVAVLIHDERVGARLHDRFLQDLEHATELRLDEFRRRGPGSRVLEHACVLLSRLL